MLFACCRPIDFQVSVASSQNDDGDDDDEEDDDASVALMLMGFCVTG